MTLAGNIASVTCIAATQFNHDYLKGSISRGELSKRKVLAELLKTDGVEIEIY